VGFIATAVGLAVALTIGQPLFGHSTPLAIVQPLFGHATVKVVAVVAVKVLFPTRKEVGPGQKVI
jgi:hypothetical protein